MNALVTRPVCWRYCAAILSLIWLGTSTVARAEDTVSVQPQFLQQEELLVYWGVLPAALLDPTTTNGNPVHMSAENTRRGGSHHLVVALYDAKTGLRVQEATVMARVEALGGSAVERPLAAMTTAGIITFGNFFPMETDTPFRIHLSIRREQNRAPVRLEWAYRHPSR